MRLRIMKRTMFAGVMRNFHTNRQSQRHFMALTPTEQTIYQQTETAQDASFPHCVFFRLLIIGHMSHKKLQVQTMFEERRAHLGKSFIFNLKTWVWLSEQAQFVVLDVGCWLLVVWSSADGVSKFICPKFI